MLAGFPQPVRGPGTLGGAASSSTDGAKAPAAQRIRNFVDTHATGIYAAWAQVADGDDRAVYKAAVSLALVRSGMFRLVILFYFHMCLPTGHRVIVAAV